MQIHAPGTDTSFTITALLSIVLHLPLYLILAVKEEELITGRPFSRVLTVFIGKIYLRSVERKGMFLFASYFTEHRHVTYLSLLGVPAIHVT